VHEHADSDAERHRSAHANRRRTAGERSRDTIYYQTWYREQRADQKRASDRRWRERVYYNAQRRKPKQQRVCAEPGWGVVFETSIPHRLYCGRTCKKRADNRRMRSRDPAAA